jgi:hypothetical protein
LEKSGTPQGYDRGADPKEVNGRDLAVVQGWADTRETLAAWNRAPFGVLGRWVGVSLAVAVALLTAVWLVATLATPDPTPILLGGVHTPASLDNAWQVLSRNLVVLALHAMACLAGFIAKSSLPAEAATYTGLWRRVHDHAGPAAIVFVGAATLFSLATQAFALGINASSIAAQLGTSPGVFLLTLTPHAIPELTALFLPLAAWLVAARAEAWHQLLAATFTTTAIALPVLVGASLIEAFVTPRLIVALHFV